MNLKISAIAGATAIITAVVFSPCSLLIAVTPSRSVYS